MSSSRNQSSRREPPQSLADSETLFTCDPGGVEAPGSFNDEYVIRGIVTQAIRLCGKSRDQIAEQMSRLLGTTVTRRALDSYTSESADQNRFPHQYTRAFCHVTGDWQLLRCVSERAGLHVISKAEQKLMELGRQYIVQKRAAESIAKLERELQGVHVG